MPITVKIKEPAAEQLSTPVPHPEALSSCFDYGSLDLTLASEAKEAAFRIKAQIAGVKVSIIAIGKDLMEIKKRLKHGSFGLWLDAEFGMSHRTARRYMLAAETLGAISDAVSDLPVKVLHALAAPSTPEEIKVEVFADVHAGKKIISGDVSEKLKATKGKIGPHTAEDAAVGTNTDIDKGNKNSAKAAGEAAVSLILKYLSKEEANQLNIQCMKAGWHGLANALKGMGHGG